MVPIATAPAPMHTAVTYHSISPNTRKREKGTENDQNERGGREGERARGKREEENGKDAPISIHHIEGTSWHSTPSLLSVYCK